MKKHNYPLHIFLFLVTVFTTMMAGAELRMADLFYWGDLTFADLHRGWLFSFAFLSFLTVHEFGHFFAARYHHVKTSLPYYIPIFIPFMMMNIGSFGAVIRIWEMPPSRRKYFDIGVAGPLAGFAVSIILLLVGFLTLPEAPWKDYLGDLHPQMKSMDHIWTLEEAMRASGGGPMISTGSNFLYDGMAALFANAQLLPPGHEVMHYPLLFVGYLTLFFTALNLLPIGQLDGGHVIYGLFGKKAHGWVSRVAVLALLFFGGTGLMELPAYRAVEWASLWDYVLNYALTFLVYLGLLVLVARRMNPNWGVWLRFGLAIGLMLIQFGLKEVFPAIEPNLIWLVYAFLAAAMIGLDHPGAADEKPLDRKRKILGWLAILIFLSCFSISPFQVFG